MPSLVPAARDARFCISRSVHGCVTYQETENLHALCRSIREMACKQQHVARLYTPGKPHKHKAVQAQRRGHGRRNQRRALFQVRERRDGERPVRNRSPEVGRLHQHRAPTIKYERAAGDRSHARNDDAMVVDSAGTRARPLRLVGINPRHGPRRAWASAAANVVVQRLQAT